MTRTIQIRRKGVALGWLNDREALELLRAEFLLPTDQYRAAGAKHWEPLHELDAEAKKKSGATAMFKKVGSIGSAAVSQAMQLTGKLASAAKRGGVQVTKSTSHLLDAFMPQIRKLVTQQMVKSSVTRVRTAVHDNEFMRKVFGATYDCLPKPVHRFVTETAFIEYCTKHRQRILGVHPGAEKNSQSDSRDLDLSPGI